MSRTELQRRYALDRHVLDDLPPFFHVEELAEFLGESVQTIISFIKRGQLAGTKTGGIRGYIIMREAVIDFVSNDDDSSHIERYLPGGGWGVTHVDSPSTRSDPFPNRPEYEIISAPTMEQPVPPTSQESVQPVTGTDEIARNPNVRCVPFLPGTPAEEIGRTAVEAVTAIQAERQRLEQQIKHMRDHEQALILAAKEAGGFSWSQLAEKFGTTKGRFVSRYDPNSIAISRRTALEYQRQLKQDAAETRKRRAS